MQVICIKTFSGKKVGVEPRRDDVVLPICGSEYSVVGEYENPIGTFYILDEYGPDKGFDARSFATLPGLTADEMAELEKEAIK